MRKTAKTKAKKKAGRFQGKTIAQMIAVVRTMPVPNGRAKTWIVVLAPE